MKNNMEYAGNFQVLLVCKSEQGHEIRDEAGEVAKNYVTEAFICPVKEFRLNFIGYFIEGFKTILSESYSYPTLCDPMDYTVDEIL